MVGVYPAYRENVVVFFNWCVGTGILPGVS